MTFSLGRINFRDLEEMVVSTVSRSRFSSSSQKTFSLKFHNIENMGSFSHKLSAFCFSWCKNQTKEIY